MWTITPTTSDYGRFTRTIPAVIPQSFIQELLARVDVVEVVAAMSRSKKGGANFMGLCPSMDENRLVQRQPVQAVLPLLWLWQERQCHRLSHARTLAWALSMPFQDLARQVGLQVPEDDVSPRSATPPPAKNRPP